MGDLLGDPEAVNPCAEKLFTRVQKLDILVNNLGIYEAKPFLEIEDAEWRRFFEANVLSGIRMTRHYLPHMLEQKWGRIIFISSESALQIPAEMVHYGMTKTAQLAVALGVAESFPASGVTVNSVLAGPTESEGVSTFVEGLAKQQGKTKEDVEREFFEHARPARQSTTSTAPFLSSSLTVCRPAARGEAVARRARPRISGKGQSSGA